MKRLAAPLLALGLFVIGVWLNTPLFLPGELPFRGSIEGGYAGISRFISEHPNPWGWNPFQYCGLPTQFMYLPALPYLTAALVRVAPHAAPDYIYRLLTAVIACLGPVAVFLFALYFTGSRRWSMAAALAYIFLSPAYGLFPEIERDRGIVQLPWRIQVLAKYGEGPHNVGLALLPIALLAVWTAAVSPNYRRILTAALVLAAIPLTNWVSALALGISCLLLMLAATGEPGFQIWRVLAAAALAYLLAAFWLTPTFVRTIVFNWPADAFGYRFGRKQAIMLAALAGCVLAIRVLFRWLRGSFYFCFVLLCAFVFGWLSTAYYIFGVDTIPESRRYALEFELFLILALAEAFRLTFQVPNQTVRLCAILTAIVMFLVGAPQVWAYTTQISAVWRPASKENTVEYRLADWIAKRHPQGRVFASGGLRFRLNAWFDLPQPGGAFESGLRNRMPVHLAYQIRTTKAIPAGREVEDTVLMLKALDVEYLVVHGPKSKEYYRDYNHSGRLDRALPVVYREDDDTIYALPARPQAFLIGHDELPEEDAQNRARVLARYVAAREDASRPTLRTRWLNNDCLVVEGQVPAGREIAVQESWDPGWEAAQDGRAIPIEKDNLGFIVLHPAPAAEARIDLRYRGTVEQRVMAGLSALAWAGLLFGMTFRLPRRKPT